MRERESRTFPLSGFPVRLLSLLLVLLVVAAMAVPAGVDARERGRRGRHPRERTPTEVAMPESAPPPSMPVEIPAAPEPPPPPPPAPEPVVIPEEAPVPDVPVEEGGVEAPPAEPAPEPGKPEADAPGEAPPAEDVPPVEEPEDERIEEPDPREEIVWVNTDSMSIVVPASGEPMAPGSSRQIVIRYQVTTPRLSTTIRAELSGDAGGWTVTSPLLADGDGAPGRAVWVEAGTVVPGSAFDLPIVVTAPAEVAVDQVVELHLWSEAWTPAGGEAGVAWPGVANAVFTAVAPEPVIPPVEVPDADQDEGPADDMPDEDAPEPDGSDEPEKPDEPDVPEEVADTVVVAGEPSYELGAGESVELALTYAVTTERTGTMAHVELVGEDGEGVDGWSYDPVEAVSDSTATAAETAFPVAITVTAPEEVDASQRVQVVVWSEVETADGAVEGIARQAVATVSVTVPAAEPVIACEAGDDLNTFACAFDPGRPDVTAASLAIAGPAGWGYAVDGVAVGAEGGVDLADAGLDVGEPGEVSIVATVPEGCVDLEVGSSAVVSLTYAYTGTEQAIAETALELQHGEPEVMAPSVSMEPFDFGTVRWDGTSWGTAQAVGTITVSRDGCGNLGAYGVQVKVVGGQPGLQPVISSVATSGEGIAVGNTGGAPGDGPVTVAQVASGFLGTGQVDVGFTLTPEGDLSGGLHEMQIRISTTVAP